MGGSLSRFIRPFTEVAQTAEQENNLCGFTVEELRRECDPPEWQAIEHDAAFLETFARSLRDSMQIDSGERPERFTAVATCTGCGDVWVPAFLASKKLVGCRWCMPRERGVKIPRPSE